MKRWTLYAVLLLCCCCSGCLYTFYPLFKPENLVFDSRLLGAWKADSDNVILAPASEEDLSAFPGSLKTLHSKIYRLSYINNNDHSRDEYLCFLVKLGQQDFLDLYPLKKYSMQGGASSLMIPGHKFFRIKIQDKKVEINALNDEFLEDEIKKKKVNIPHLVRSDGTVLITASTDVLQQYVLKYANVTNAFEVTPATWKK